MSADNDKSKDSIERIRTSREALEEQASGFDTDIDTLDFADLVWEPDCTEVPTLDDDPVYDCAPVFLKANSDTIHDTHTKSVTETGSYDLRWITLLSFGKLLHAIPMPILLMDSHGFIQIANTSFLRMAESPIHTTGVSFFDYFATSPVDIRALFRDSLTQRKPQLHEGSITISNKAIWTRTHLRPIRFGRDRSVLALIEDLSVEKREAAINAKHKRLVDVFPMGIAEFALAADITPETNPLLLTAVLLDSKMREGNSRFAQQHGQPDTSGLLGRRLREIMPNIRKEAHFYQEWAQSGFLMAPFETYEITENGGLRYYENTLVPNCRDGVLKTFWLTKQDITDRITTEQDLKEKIKTIDELHEHILQSKKAKAIANHTAKVAHELRQPLAIIGGFARRMSKECATKPETQKEMQEFKIIIKEIERLEKILGGLIDFTRREALNVQMVKPDAIVRYIAHINQDRAAERGVRIELRFDDDDTTALLDPERFQQVVRNILGNAVEGAYPNSVILVSSRVVENCEAEPTAAESGRFFELKIENSGPTIPAEDLDRIFDPFYSTKDYATGLGLTMARKIIEDHHGSISVQSADESTLFTVWLPLDPMLCLNSKRPDEHGGDIDTSSEPSLTY